MKVKELIEQLQQFNLESKVEILTSGDSPFDYGYGIKRVYEIKSNEDKVTGVYIEEE